MNRESIGHYAVITGASAGLGEQFARLFAKDRIPLILIARRKDRLEALKKELESAYQITVHVLALDMTSPTFAKDVSSFLKSQKIEVEYLVNNAGYGQNGEFAEIPLEHNLGQIDLNIRALVELTHLLLPAMKKRNRGHILNIGSTAGYQPGPHMAVYYATKAFVNSFSQALQYELKNTGVKVTLSCPGATITEFGTVSGVGNKKLFKMGAMSADEVAAEAYTAMMKGKRTIIHGVKNKLGAHMTGVTPTSALLKIVSLLNSSR